MTTEFVGVNDHDLVCVLRQIGLLRNSCVVKLWTILLPPQKLSRNYIILLLWSTVYKSFVFLTDTYLKLEDVTRKFNKPCIMDVKIGQKSYDPYASAEKIQQQVSKYPLMEEIGFLVLGMRVRTCFVFKFSLCSGLLPHTSHRANFSSKWQPSPIYM